MSMAEIADRMRAPAPLDRATPIASTTMPDHLVRILAGHGITTIGALVDTDAYRAVTSGRYDIERIREVNGIPVTALLWPIYEVRSNCANMTVHAG